MCKRDATCGLYRAVVSIEARLEIHLLGAAQIVALDGERLTIGRSAADIPLQDPTVSGLHAVVERVTGGWIIQDLGSRNGTFVNGLRLMGPQAMRSGDDLRLGSSRITFTSGGPSEEATSTAPLQPAPRLTPRERDLLVALCRPLLRGSLLAEPANISAIAHELVVSESAVKKLLGRAFDRFGLHDEERRRPRLALEALRRGAVSMADLEADAGE